MRTFSLASIMSSKPAPRNTHASLLPASTAPQAAPSARTRADDLHRGDLDLPARVADKAEVLKFDESCRLELGELDRRLDAHSDEGLDALSGIDERQLPIETKSQELVARQGRSPEQAVAHEHVLVVNLKLQRVAELVAVEVSMKVPHRVSRALDDPGAEATVRRLLPGHPADAVGVRGGAGEPPRLPEAPRTGDDHLQRPVRAEVAGRRTLLLGDRRRRREGSGGAACRTNAHRARRCW
mmetsp:Transcript_26282/g.74790  ORF Transcript_26282/g.74790 Transcript_26282/m.74790 type:complete len:240 (-) Transcript_26282:48-767(-)